MITPALLTMNKHDAMTRTRKPKSGLQICRGPQVDGAMGGSLPDRAGAVQVPTAAQGDYVCEDITYLGGWGPPAG